MSNGDWSSLRELPLPVDGEVVEFTYKSRRYRFAKAGVVWTLTRDDDARLLGELAGADDRWIFVSPENDGEWHDTTHYLAIEGFLDDNDAWEATHGP
jgi:hypothetical protein